jgi:Transcriptional regulator, AbiEi antitoxin, Type IV TA system/Transcriptional regulator, AbiEi antitoxin N-terminal domain
MSQYIPLLLERLPEDIPVTAVWLHQLGLSSGLIQKYCKTGYLRRLGSTNAYVRPGEPNGRVPLEAGMYSLQQQGYLLWVGGITALEWQGLFHQVPVLTQQHLYHLDIVPKWLKHFAMNLHRGSLFGEHPQIHALPLEVKNFRIPSSSNLPISSVLGIKEWSQRTTSNTPLLFISTPERAILEVIQNAPEVSYEYLDTLFENVGHLRPDLLTLLLNSCQNIKVTRVFLHFAKRHAHPWWPAISQKTFNLGTGKRQVYFGGQLDPDYLITIPTVRDYVF